MKKRVAYGLMIPLMSGMLAACGSSGTEKGAASEVKPSVAPTSSEPVELVFYSIAGVAPDDFNLKYGDRISKKFPNVKVKFIPNGKGTTLPELLASGTSIDVYYESIGQFAEGLITNKLQYDMTDLMKKHGVDLNRFEPTLIDAMKTISNGGIYGLPANNLVLALYHNKDLFDKFGVPYIKDGNTWDELLDASRKLTRNDGGKQYIGLAVSPAHILRLNPFALPYVDPKTEKPTITNENWKLVLQYGFAKPAEFPGYREKMQSLGNKLPAGTSFTKDKDMAMYIGLSNIFTNEGTANEMSTMNWDMASVPTFKEAPGVATQSYPIYMSVTSVSKHKDEAMEVIKYITSDDVQMDYSQSGIISSLKSDAVKNAFGQATKFKDKNIKSIFYYKFAPISAKSVYDVPVENAYRKDLTDLALGKIDINTVIRNAEEAANKAIQDAKSK